VLAEQQTLFDGCEPEHRWNEVLTQAGVRWCVLRWVPRSVRRDLALQVLSRVAPEDTKRAESAALWLDEVKARIERSPRFKRACSRVMAMRVAETYAALVERDGRPLTWITQEEIAAAVGRSDRTVRRYLDWLRAEGLLHELVPGTRLPSMDRPEDETEDEADARRQREAEGIRAEEAARQRAREAFKAHKDAERQQVRAELDAVRAGHRGSAAAEVAENATADLDLPDLAAVIEEARAILSAANEATLLNIAPTYELRLPLSEAELAEAAGLREAMTSANAAANAAETRNVHPPHYPLEKEESSECVRDVEKKKSRGASRRRDNKGAHSAVSSSDLDAAGLSEGSEGDRLNRRASRALRAAEALLGGELDPKVTHGVSLRWLTARIRGSRLLDHDWTIEDLADCIHGRPEQPHLPKHIRSPRAWIHARLAAATPAMPPSRLAQVLEVENTHVKARRQVRQAADARDRAAAIRACSHCDEVGLVETAAGVQRCRHDSATAACSMCDTAGWLLVDDLAGVEVRCSHDPATSGW
jgi:hypothetical protein